MKTPTLTYVMLGVLVASFALSLGAASCNAADRSFASIESGRPRELINQPVCWPPEEFADARHCDFAGKI